jgi:subtilisin-like proprotein convertase family protein
MLSQFMKQLFPLILFLLICVNFTYGQLSVQNNQTAQQLADNLAGPNVTVFNATLYDTLNFQTGSFNYTGNDLGLNAGIILSSGDISDAIGPNSQSGTTGSPYLFIPYTDSILENIVGTNIADYTYLEFEFEVQGDEIAFNYIFLSEEYNEFVNANYNDAFAFVISGPGIVGEENLAVVPNTTDPITVHSINNNSYWQYYIDNDLGVGTANIEYDGFTQLLTARKTGLQPCSVYKISLRIADGNDNLYDSAVMLEANSLVSNSIQVVGSSYSSDTTALEGCIPARYTFDLGYIAAQDLNIPIRLEGTALNGIDYQYIDSFITIPQGQSSSTIIINSLQDGFVEGRESIQLIYRPSTSTCVPEDTVLLYIDDASPISYTAIGTNLTCNDDSTGSIQVNIAGGTSPYRVQYTDTLTGFVQNIAAINLPITRLNASTYSLEVFDQYGCTADAIVAGGLHDAGQIFLPDGTGISYTNSISINDFNVGQNLSSIQQINAICATLEHSYAGDLSIELIAPNGAAIQLKGVGNTNSGVAACNLGEPVASGPSDTWSNSNLSAGVGYQYCWTSTPTYPTMIGMISPSSPGPPPTYTYTTLAGNTYTDYYLPAGSYTPRQSFFGLLGTPLNGNWTLRITDNYIQDNGYLFDWSISLKADLPDSIVTLEEPPIPNINSSLTNPTCNLSDGAINLSIGGLFPPYSYLWSNGASSQNISGLTSGTYTVTLTDGNSCTYEHSIALSNSTGPTLSATIYPETCTNTTDGAIDLLVGGGSLSFIWSNGATSEDLNNLAAGTYSVSISDNSNCLTIANYTIDVALPIYSSARIMNENCGDQEGEITLEHTGGVSPYNYLWSNGETSQDVQDLEQGIYTVSITDANNCIVIDTFQLINLVGNCIPSCDLNITTTQLIDENCANENGSISLSTQSTGGSIAYLWSNGASNNAITNLSAGEYKVTISDVRGCELIDSFFITNQTNGLEVISINTVEEYCSRANGTMEVVAVGGIQPYTYLWSNNATSSQISNLSQGVYHCTITDVTACSIIISDTVFNETGNFRLTYENSLDATCNDSTGSIDITTTGGNWPFTYQWSDGSTTEDLRAIPAGNYSCTISEHRGCSIVTQTYVIQNTSGNFQLDNIDIDPEICGNTGGEIILDVIGGATPYTYIWNTGATSHTIRNLSSGLYAVTVVDAIGCQIEPSNLVVGNTSGSLSIDAIQVFNENCANNTGSIHLAISGNIGNLSYLWNTGSNSSRISNLNAGNYSCTISDTLGCLVTTSSQVLNQIGNLALTSRAIIDENCTQQNGAIDITVGGGNMPYAYLWSNGSTTEDITNVGQGNYSCVITDVNGCQIIENFIVLNNTSSYTLITPILSNDYCNQSSGAIDINIISNNSPFTYLWSNSETTEDLSSLTQGVYSCTVTDDSNCQIILGPYNIRNNSATVLNPSQITPAVCNNSNGAIDIHIISGNTPYSYLWSNGATSEDLTNLNQGNYSCTITDASGCTTILSENVQSITGTFVVSSAILTEEECSNNLGAINISIQGGTTPYSYQWSNGSTTEDLINLNQGNYSCTIMDATGCSISTNYAINNSPGTFQITNTTVYHEVCGNSQGTIDVHIGNGVAPYSYQWSNGSTTEDITNLSTGLYTQTTTDDNGCILIHSNYISNNSGTLFLDNSNEIDETCSNQNGAIDLSILGGTIPYRYQWSNGDTTSSINGLTSGLYTCTVTDSMGCTLISFSSINNLGGDLQISTINTLDNHCSKANGSIHTSITGGSEPYSYHWNSNTIEQCGNYTLNMYIPFSMSAQGWRGYPIAAVRISINNTIYGYYAIPVGVNNNFESASIPVCAGDSIQLEYLGDSTRTYAYELLDAQGNMLFQDWPLSGSGLMYSDEVTGIAVGQGTNYYAGLTGGAYTLTVIDSNGCSIEQTIQINNLSDSLIIQSVTLSNESCGNQDGSIDLNILGVNSPTYLWSNGTNTKNLSNLKEGTYSITITDITGCSLTDTYLIDNDANNVNVATASILSDTCNTGNGNINLTISGGQPPYSFNWNNGFTINNIINLSTGYYDVTITDAQSCKIREQYYIPNHSQGISIEDSIIHETCINSMGAISLTVTGGIPPYLYLWSNGATSSNISGLSTGLYTCSITDATGCMDVWSDTVKQIKTPIYVPNAVYRNSTCFDTATIAIIPAGAIYLNAVGGTPPLSYLWSNSTTNNILENVYSGIYSLTVTDVNGCSLVDSFELDLHITENLFSTIDSTIIPEYCNDNQGEITLTFSPFLGVKDYIWSTGATTANSITSTISNLSAGVYSVTISQFYVSSAVNGTCTTEKTFVVPDDRGTINIDSINYLDESCHQSNGLINLYISGGTLPYSYLWSNGTTSSSITNITSGLYNVTVTDNAGCQINQQGIYIQNLSYGLGIQSASIVDEQCGTDGEISVSISGGTLPYSYLWSNGEVSSNISGLNSGIHYLTVTEANGCSIVDSFTVNAGTNPLLLTTQIIHPTCNQPNGVINLSLNGGSPPYRYIWNTMDTTQSIFNLAVGTYTVTIEDNNACLIVSNVILADTSNLVQLTSTDTTSTSCSSCSDGAIDLSLNSNGGPYTFLWSNGLATEDLNSLTAGTYSVTITNVDGCTLDTSFTVSTSVGVVRIPSLIKAKVYPNPSDGNFVLEFNTPLREAFTIHIYNNIGQVIYTKKLDGMGLDQIIHLQLDDAVSGIYLLQLTSEEKYFTQKIIIQ